MLSLRIVGVRDWRVYGAFALWPPVIGEIRVSHLTPFLCLLVALAWRYRDVRCAPGLAVGLAGAVKFFLWPLGVWLAAIGKARETLVAAAVAGASLLLVLPFTGLDDYFRTLLELGDTFDQDSYSPFGFLVQIGAPETARARRDARDRRRAPRCAAGAGRASALAVAAALVLSPIVWLDYYAVAAVPLALVRPRLSAVWLVPLATWGLLERGHRRRERLGQRPRADRVHDRLRGDRAGGARGDGAMPATTPPRYDPCANRRLEPRSSPD